jgi:hypothetical protein
MVASLQNATVSPGEVTVAAVGEYEKRRTRRPLSASLYRPNQSPDSVEPSRPKGLEFVTRSFAARRSEMRFDTFSFGSLRIDDST